MNAIRDMVKSKYSVWFTQRSKVINRKTEGMFSLNSSGFNSAATNMTPNQLTSFASKT